MIRPISVAELREHGAALFPRHFAEVEAQHLGLVLGPDWERIELLHRHGAAVVLGAFVGEELVGYALALIGSHVFYRGTINAQLAAVYVAPEHRGKGLGARLILQARGDARDMGATTCTANAKRGTAMADLLPRIGFDEHETIFTERL